MAEGCTHNCSTCSSNCSSRNAESLRVPLNELSSVKHVIGVVSGKGGVGKSLVTSMLAVLMQREGKKVAILDADITGPSIPKAFGMKPGVEGGPEGMFIILAIFAAFDTIIETSSWGLLTITIPSRGRDWYTVRGTSPVPGGQSTNI